MERDSYDGNISGGAGAPVGSTMDLQGQEDLAAAVDAGSPTTLMVQLVVMVKLNIDFYK
jgi:hypothetical protein